MFYILFFFFFGAGYEDGKEGCEKHIFWGIIFLL